MTRRDLKRRRPAGRDPFEHNRAVRRRKELRALILATEQIIARYATRPYARRGTS